MGTECETASQECEEECGLKLGRQTLDCLVDPVRHAQRSHTIFLVHDTRTPQPRSEILAVRHVKWDEIDTSKYHPRLKYDYTVASCGSNWLRRKHPSTSTGTWQCGACPSPPTMASPPTLSPWGEGGGEGDLPYGMPELRPAVFFNTRGSVRTASLPALGLTRQLRLQCLKR